MYAMTQKCDAFINMFNTLSGVRSYLAFHQRYIFCALVQ